MITVISGTNRPGSNTRKVAGQIEEIYTALKVPVRLLDLAMLPPEIFFPGAYAEKPAAFQPFSDAVLQSSGLHGSHAWWQCARDIEDMFIIDMKP